MVIILYLLNSMANPGRTSALDCDIYPFDGLTIFPDGLDLEGGCGYEGGAQLALVGLLHFSILNGDVVFVWQIARTKMGF